MLREVNMDELKKRTAEYMETKISLSRRDDGLIKDYNEPDMI